MRKTLMSAGFGAALGGTVGVLVALGGALIDPSMTAFLGRLIAVSGGIGGYAGLLVGGLSLRASAGGSRLRSAAGPGLCLGAAVLLAQFVFDIRRPLALVAWATAGALVGGRARLSQFSLGSLFAFIFAISAALAAFISGPWEQWRFTTRAVERGALVRYERRAPAWAIDLFGDMSRHWFDGVTELQLFDASDADIPRLKRLPHLERLGLGGTGLSDRGLRQLTAMEKLRSLELHDLPSISDGGLDCLPELKNLDELWLGDPKISDAGFEQIRRMPRLRKLTLYLSSVTDSGFAAVEGLTNLEELTLYSTPNLTAAASFESIGRLHKLKVLRVGMRQTNDAALAHLKSLDELECLQLPNCRITGVGFQDLESLRSLRRVTLWGETTNEGLAAIARLGHLTNLDFGGYRVTDDGIATLATLKDLEFLSIQGTSATDASLEHLRALTNLQCLHIQSGGISKAAVDRLRAEMQLAEDGR